MSPYPEQPTYIIQTSPNNSYYQAIAEQSTTGTPSSTETNQESSRKRLLEAETTSLFKKIKTSGKEQTSSLSIDPIPEMPKEILSRIFSYLNFCEMQTLSSVNSTWDSCMKYAASINVKSKIDQIASILKKNLSESFLTNFESRIEQIKEKALERTKEAFDANHSTKAIIATLDEFLKDLEKANKLMLNLAKATDYEHDELLRATREIDSSESKRFENLTNAFRQIAKAMEEYENEAIAATQSENDLNDMMANPQSALASFRAKLEPKPSPLESPHTVYFSPLSYTPLVHSITELLIKKEEWFIATQWIDLCPKPCLIARISVHTQKVCYKNLFKTYSEKYGSTDLPVLVDSLEKDSEDYIFFDALIEFLSEKGDYSTLVSITIAKAENLTEQEHLSLLLRLAKICMLAPDTYRKISFLETHRCLKAVKQHLKTSPEFQRACKDFLNLALANQGYEIAEQTLSFISNRVIHSYYKKNIAIMRPTKNSL